MNIAKNLQILRKMADMTQEELAEKMNVSRQTVSKWELGSALPEVDKLLELGKMFNCSLDQLLRDNMDFGNEAYSDIKIVSVEPFRYISYAVISCEPEEDAIAHAEGWAERLGIAAPHIIGWDYPHVSQEQKSVFHMRGYAAALILSDGQGVGDIDVQVNEQGRQRYITISLKEKEGEEFTLIPNAYKALLMYMATNGIKEKRDPAVISCYEHEYFDDVGDKFMDIYIAVD